MSSFRLPSSLCGLTNSWGIDLGTMCLTKSHAPGANHTSQSNMTLSIIKNDFVTYEGIYPHMYLDTKGLVTVGVGKMLPNVKSAIALPFYDKITRQQATAKDIEQLRLSSKIIGRIPYLLGEHSWI